MSEINQSSEGLKIPEHWNFPEKSSDPTDIIVDQVDEDQNYLRFHFATDDPMKRETEYFFSRYGEPVDKRELSSFLPYILHWGEVDIQYSFEGDLYNRFRFFVNFSHREADLLADRVKELEKDYSKETMTEPGGFSFTRKGELKMVLIGMPFMEQDGNFIPVALIVLDLISGGNRLNAKDYRPTSEEIDPKYRIIDNSEPNKIILKNIQGEDAFITEWDIKMEEDKRGRKVPFLVVNRRHSTTGIVQTLSSPIQVDSGLITEAAFAKPPYPKDEKGRLIVPWTNIGQLVGARISYSYPPPKKP